LRHGDPVHITTLLAEIGLEINRDTRASLAGSLAGYVRRGEIFTRPAPNTFGLIELGHTPNRELRQEELEPPVNSVAQPALVTPTCHSKRGSNSLSGGAGGMRTKTSWPVLHLSGAAWVRTVLDGSPMPPSDVTFKLDGEVEF
jgi:hypothetical protein